MSHLETGPYRIPTKPRRWKKRGGPARSMSSVLSGLLAKPHLQHRIARYQFVRRWEEVVGQELLRFTAPDMLRGNCLIVRVDSAARAQELAFYKEVFLHRLNTLLKEEGSGAKVRDLQFKVDPKSFDNVVRRANILP